MITAASRRATAGDNARISALQELAWFDAVCECGSKHDGDYQSDQMRVELARTIRT